MASGSAIVGAAVLKLQFDDSGVSGQLKKYEGQFETGGKKSGTIFGNALSVAMGNMLQKGLSKATSLVTNQIDDAVHRADTLNRFPKVMEMLGYSAEDAANAVSKLKDGVKGIPTSLADVVSGTQRLASLTGDVDKASDWALALSDAMLLTTGDVNDASRGMEQFIQILSRGKPQGNDWNTIMEVASPVMNRLAKSLGYVGAELGGDFYTALQDGTLAIDDMMTALVELDKNSGDGLESLHEGVKTATGGIGATITNLQQSISNAIVDIIQTIGSENIESVIQRIRDVLVGMVDIIKNITKFVKENWNVIAPIAATLAGITTAVVAINKASKAFKATQTAVNAVVGGFKKVLGGASSGISSVAGKLGGSEISGATEKIGNIFTSLKDTIKNAVTGISEILTTMVNAIMEPIKAVLKGVGEALAGFFSALSSPEVLAGAINFAVVAASIAAAIFLIGTAIEAVTPALVTLFNDLIMPLTQFVADTLMGILETVRNMIVFLTQSALIPLIDTLSGAFTGVIDTVANLLTNVIGAALDGVAKIVVAVGDGFEKMGIAIKMALDGVSGVLNAFADLIKSIASAAVAMVALVTGHSVNYGNDYVHLFSKGGKVEGEGTETSDSIPAMLSDGEYVINARAAQMLGYDYLDALNSGTFYGLETGFESDYGGSNREQVFNITMNNNINSELDAQKIGRVMMQSIRRAA